MKPQPQTQVPKRVGMRWPVAASAWPSDKRKQSSSSSATPTATPLTMPRNTLRRDMLFMSILRGQPGLQKSTLSSSRSEIVKKLRLRSEEHTSELQSLMRTSYAVFCLKKKKTTQQHRKKRH